MPDRQADPATENEAGQAPRSGLRFWLVLPVVAFVALAVLFMVQLESGRDPSAVPSPLIDKPVPQFSLPALEGASGGGGDAGGLDTTALATGVHVVNIFASWCAPCREEHPILLDLAKDKRFSLVGINYKDVPDNAVNYLGALGNPFARIGADRTGRSAIDWGVYGVPETFVVKNGTIVYKFVGPLSPQSLQAQLMPAIEKALAQP
nr:DsbE family thiol:disulfide interchange protein [Faunimonas pinastri]